MSDTRELRAVLTVVDGFTKPINDFNKKISDITKSATKIPIRAEDQATAEVKRVMGSVDKLQKVAQQPLRVTMQDFISANIAKIALKLEALRLKGIIPVGMSTGLAAGGLAAGAIGIAAVGVGIAATIPAAADLEAAMIRINKLIGMEGDAAKGVQKDVQNMMMATGQGLDQISAAYETAGGAGIGGDKMALGDFEGARKEISDFVQITLEAASAFGMSADATSGMLSGIANVYKPIGQETNKFLKSVGSGIDAVADATIASEEKIMTAMSHASSAMAMFEQNDKTVKDTIALSAALISTNMSGDAAGEAIKDFFNYAKTDADAKISKSLGMSQAGYQEKLKADPMAIMNAVNAKYNSMKAAEQGEYSKLFGMTGGKIPQLSGSANFQAGLTKAQGVVNPAYDAGTKMSESFGKSIAGFWTQLDKVRQTITVLAEIVGGIFLPGLNAILGVVNALIIPFVKLIQFVVGLATAIPGLNFVVAVAGFGFIVNVIGLLIPAITGLIAKYGILKNASLVLEMWTNLIGKAFSFSAIKAGLMATYTKAAAAAQWALNAAAAANPYVLLALVIIGIVAAIGYLLYKTGYLQKAWDKFKNSAIGKDLIGGIVAGVAWVTTAFNDLFTWLDKQWADMSSGAGTGLLGVLGTIMGALGGLFDKVDNAYKSGDLGKLAMNVAMAIFPPLMLIKPILMIFDVIKNTVVWLLEKLVGVFEWAVSLWKRAVSFLEWLWGGIKGMIGWLKDGLGITKAEKQQKVTDIASKAGLHQENGVWWKDNVKADDPKSGVPRETLARLKKAEEDVAKAPTGIFEGIPGVTELTKVIQTLTDAIKNFKMPEIADLVPTVTNNGGLFDTSGMSDSERKSESFWDASVREGKSLLKLAEGTDYVPRTGIALLHQGERVIPASQNKGHGATNIIVNASAHIDKIASDFDMRKLENMMKRAALTAVKDALSQRRT